MSKKKTVIVILLLICGMIILCYPMVSNWINEKNGSHAIQMLEKDLKNADIAEQRKMAEEYNAKLRTGQEVSEEEYYQIINMGNGIIGYIEIPKIGINLPVYHGVEEEILSKAIGHMPKTAFPIGGKGNHTVLTGHTGLPKAKLFTDLTELDMEDTFSVVVLGDTLTYKVDQIKVVLPEDGEDLMIVQDKDYCTLVTCTPYGINSHRLLIRGERVESTGIEMNELQQIETEDSMFSKYWLIPVIAMTIVFYINHKIRKYKA